MIKKQMVQTYVANFSLLWFSYRVVVETLGRTSVPNSNLSNPPPPGARNELVIIGLCGVCNSAGH